jgi:serine protease Do
MVTSAPRPSPLAAALADTVIIEGDDVYGSGVLISPADGLVLTAQHVIDGVSNPVVTFYDGGSAPATLVDQDLRLDVALLKVPPRPGASPVVADITQVQAGDPIFAIGDPRRMAFSVSRGIVSFPGRSIEGARYLQTDLPINDGNSGGPVLSEDGHLIGIMSFILRGSQGLAFALPVTYALERFSTYLCKDSASRCLVDKFRGWESTSSL